MPAPHPSQLHQNLWVGCQASTSFTNFTGDSNVERQGPLQALYKHFISTSSQNRSAPYYHPHITGEDNTAQKKISKLPN